METTSWVIWMREAWSMQLTKALASLAIPGALFLCFVSGFRVGFIFAGMAKAARRGEAKAARKLAPKWLQ
eukprot:157535-Heterocapsa_arctica.AAC.1